MVVFVYGTLTEGDRVATVLGDDADSSSSVAHRSRAPPSRRPIPHARARRQRRRTTARGRRYGPRATRPLRGRRAELYVRVAVPVTGAAGTASERCWVYVGDPDQLGVDATWPGEGAPRPRSNARFTERCCGTQSRFTTPVCPPSDGPAIPPRLPVSLSPRVHEIFILRVPFPVARHTPCIPVFPVVLLCCSTSLFG